nr:IS3 family transposase [Enterococcus faecium]
MVGKAWLEVAKAKKLDKPDKYSKIKQEITAIVKESRNSYGYRRVTLALKMKGYTINHKTVRKLMSQMGLTCQIRIKRYKSYKGTVGKIAKNVLKRNFSVDTPNKKWVTDQEQDLSKKKSRLKQSFSG